jgi:hypothetical protein
LCPNLVSAINQRWRLRRVLIQQQHSRNTGYDFFIEKLCRASRQDNLCDTIEIDGGELWTPTMGESVEGEKETRIRQQGRAGIVFAFA